VGVSVRRANLSDVPTITQLVVDEASEVVAREPTFRYIPDAPNVERRYASRVRDPGRAVFVAVIDQAFVGFVDAVLVEKVDAGAYLAPGLDVYIEEVIVTSDARRRGVGTLLIRAVEEWAKEAGARMVTLDTHVTNESARRLYATLGYREVGVVIVKSL
jgi:ribosomal protein S18 acetylase RimI-like enzyme